VSPEVKHGRQSWGLQNPDTRINLAFSVRLADRNIEQAEAKTTKDQTIQKRTEPAFIEPMQCKPVSELRSGEKWTCEIKFDGYRCIAVKRGREVTLFSRHKKVLNRRFSRVVQALASLGATSFSMVNWSPSMRKGDLPFSFCKTTSRGLFRFISTPLTSSTVAGNFC
jgi:ATP dependent DNA ligase domain